MKRSPLAMGCLYATAPLLEQSTFIGHDSGISHRAALASALLSLIGPTDPKILGATKQSASVLLAPNGI